METFLRADFVVKAVILILNASSIFSWALIFDKVRLFRRIDISTKSFEDKFWKSKSAEAFYKNLPQKSEDPLTIIFKSAMNEVIKTRSKSTAVQSARVERVIEVSIDNQLKSIEKKFYISCYHWFNCSIHRSFWNSLGNYEFISINSYF